MTTDKASTVGPSTIMGFLLLGVTIGWLTGLSASPLATSVVALLFAFSGGSTVALLNKLSDAQLRITGTMLACLCLGTLIGTVSGIFVSENRLLTFVKERSTRESASSTKYLKSTLADDLQIAINQRNDNIITEKEFRAKVDSLMSSEPKDGR